jgi:hypothetical protein
MTAAPETPAPASGRPMRGRLVNPQLRAAAACVAIAAVVGGCSSSAHSTAGGSSPSPSTGSTTSTSSPTSSASTSKAASSSTPAASGGGISKTCPTVAQIHAATGANIPLVQNQAAEGGRLCDYNATATGTDVVATVTPDNGVSVGTFQTVISTEAKAQHVDVKPLGGYGQAAYTYVLNDASTNSDHTATTTIGIYNGSDYVILTGTLALSKIEAVARLFLH